MDNIISNVHLECKNVQHVAKSIMAPIGLYLLYIALTEIPDRYVEVDPDIWTFLKFVLVLFVGWIGWSLREGIGSIKRLDKTINVLEQTVAVNNKSVEVIQRDVSEINSKLEKHDERILDLEKRKN